MTSSPSCRYVESRYSTAWTILKRGPALHNSGFSRKMETIHSQAFLSFNWLLFHRSQIVPTAVLVLVFVLMLSCSCLEGHSSSTDPMHDLELCQVILSLPCAGYSSSLTRRLSPSKLYALKTPAPSRPAHVFPIVPATSSAFLPCSSLKTLISGPLAVCLPAPIT